jgi:MarR family transcriptional regulator, temperature-dependent positive regulator of motility
MFGRRRPFRSGMSGIKESKQFSRSLSHLLKRAVQFSVHLYMDDAGKSGLTHRQYIVLQAADANDGKSQTELVKITGIDRSTLADLVARLMAQGYLQRKRSKDDARANAVRLTLAGKKALKGAQSGAEDVDKRLLSFVSSADRKPLIDCLATLAAEMDKIETTEPEKVATKVKLRRKA